MYDRITAAARRKKSFELNYGGGTLWAEHLDGLGTDEGEALYKLEGDSRTFLRPSSSSFMIVNLDETVLTPVLAERLVSLLSRRRFMKVAFVGVPWQKTRLIMGISAAVRFFDDYERAKQWTIGEG